MPKFTATRRFQQNAEPEWVVLEQVQPFRPTLPGWGRQTIAVCPDERSATKIAEALNGIEEHERIARQLKRLAR